MEPFHRWISQLLINKVTSCRSWETAVPFHHCRAYWLPDNSFCAMTLPGDRGTDDWYDKMTHFLHGNGSYLVQGRLSPVIQEATAGDETTQRSKHLSSKQDFDAGSVQIKVDIAEVNLRSVLLMSPNAPMPSVRWPSAKGILCLALVIWAYMEVTAVGINGQFRAELTPDSKWIDLVPSMTSGLKVYILYAVYPFLQI